MKVHRKCFFFRSGDHEIFWVQHTKGKDADAVHYSDCYFFSSGENEIVKIVDHVHGVTYYPHPDFPKVFQE